MKATAHSYHAARQPAPQPRPLGRVATPAIQPGQRELMIAEAAYYLAERRGFAPGAELEDWVAAESEIDRLFENLDAEEGAEEER